VIETLAIAGYRSLRDVAIPLSRLTVVTGANGSGKSSLYRALRLLSDVAQGRVIASLAGEGGLSSTLWAGPESFSRGMRDGTQPVQGTRRHAPVHLRLGFVADDYGYAIDLGLPIPSPTRFTHDPEIKVEALWTGGASLQRGLIAERRGPGARVRSRDTGEWRQSATALTGVDSMMMHCADPVDGYELLMLRERMRRWRFYDNLRTDRDAPARRPQIGTFTPVLASDGGDMGAAVQTILEIGDADLLEETIADAFDGAGIEVGGQFDLLMRQPGLLRPLATAELSDGTLRYLLLAAALLSPRPPELLILNEPEASLHPRLLAPLGRLMVQAATRCQLIVISHATALVEALERADTTLTIALDKQLGETLVDGVPKPSWTWPRR
jgi:predicted ATPase